MTEQTQTRKKSFGNAALLIAAMFLALAIHSLVLFGVGKRPDLPPPGGDEKKSAGLLLLNRGTGDEERVLEYIDLYDPAGAVRSDASIGFHADWRPAARGIPAAPEAPEVKIVLPEGKKTDLDWHKKIGSTPGGEYRQWQGGDTGGGPAAGEQGKYPVFLLNARKVELPDLPKEGNYGVSAMMFYGGTDEFGRFEVIAPGRSPERDAELVRYMMRNYRKIIAMLPEKERNAPFSVKVIWGI